MTKADIPPHVLDRPIWSAYTGRLQAFGRANTFAARAAPDVGPFAAARDDTPEAIAALSTLAPERGSLCLMQVGDAPAPDDLRVVGAFAGVQMVAEAIAAPSSITEPIVPLTNADATQMRALAALTKPGPFFARTHELGAFWGVWIEGRLAAMAGERLKTPGFTEISAVCTHPDHRGRGFAAALMAKVAAGIFARGERPMLHAYADNAAIGLYQRLGFATRADITAKWLTRPGGGGEVYGR